MTGMEIKRARSKCITDGCIGVSATEALLLAEDKLFWRTIATAGGSG